jgi:5-methylcytosine-specific restriction endonuclease McrA
MCAHTTVLLRAKHLPELYALFDKERAAAAATGTSDVWTDHEGRPWKVPTTKKRLKFSKVRSHAALRAFVFQRDAFTCAKCGVKPVVIPEVFTGETTVSLPGKHWCLVMDHIVSRRNGGPHHPSNLQTMCDSCNAQKVGLVDAKHPAALERRRQRDKRFEPNHGRE